MKNWTDGIRGFFVKIFSGLLKFLPGRDVDHLSIWEGGRGPPRAKSGSCLFFDPPPSLRRSAPDDRFHCSLLFALPLSFYKPWPQIRENVRPILFVPSALVWLTDVVLCLALPFVYNFVAGAIAGMSQMVVSQKVFIRAHISLGR